MAEVHGNCDDRFTAVREALARNLEGDELGASVAVDLDGETVVDLWGGYRDLDRTTPWTQDTIVNGWSTTKTVLALAALMLVERGELDVYAPVGDYWPEFSANGKKNVEVRHLLATPRASPAGTRRSRSRTCTTGRPSTERLAAQAPWWEPGTASGYHANNQGHLVGEVIRRITGKTFKKFVAEEIAGPLGADYQIGARESDWDRIAPRRPAAADGHRLLGAGPEVGAVPDVHRAGGVGRCGELAGVAARGPGGAERALERARAADGDADDVAGR